MAVEEGGHATVSLVLALTEMEQFAVQVDRDCTNTVPARSVRGAPTWDNIN